MFNCVSATQVMDATSFYYFIESRVKKMCNAGKITKITFCYVSSISEILKILRFRIRPVKIQNYDKKKSRKLFRKGLQIPMDGLTGLNGLTGLA